MFRVAAILVLAVCVYGGNPPNRAIVIITHPLGPVSGTIRFTEVEDVVHIEGEIKGLAPGKHGFHVHQKGNLYDGCNSAGGHLNPFKKTHGAPDAEERHVGDLGNIIADQNGIARINFNDSAISVCNSERGILGRALVIHENEDDLGLGNFDDSKTTGHAGARVGCGVIGYFEGTVCTNSGLKASLNFGGIMIAASLALLAGKWMCLQQY